MSINKLLMKFERWGDLYFSTKAPSLPRYLRKMLVAGLPWLLAMLVLLLIPLLYLGLRLGTSLLVGSAFSASFRPFYYISLGVLALEVGLIVRALSPLNRRHLRGWRLVFYAVLVNIGYGAIRLLADPMAVFGLLWSILLSLTGLYLLFQIKDSYTT